MQRHAKSRAGGEESTESDSDDDDVLSATDSLVEAADTPPAEIKDPLTGKKSAADRPTSVAQDVIHKIGRAHV